MTNSCESATGKETSNVLVPDDQSLAALNDVQTYFIVAPKSCEPQLLDKQRNFTGDPRTLWSCIAASVQKPSELLRLQEIRKLNCIYRAERIGAVSLAEKYEPIAGKDWMIEKTFIL